MAVSWEAFAAIIGIVTAVLGALGAVLTLWKTWVQHLHDQIKQKDARIADLEDQVDPAIALGRDQFRKESEERLAKINERTEEIGKLRAELSARDIAIAECQTAAKGREEKLRKAVQTSNRNYETAMQLKAKVQSLQEEVKALNTQLDEQRQGFQTELDRQATAKDDEWAGRLTDREEEGIRLEKKMTDEKLGIEARLAEKIEECEAQLRKIKELDAENTIHTERHTRVRSMAGRVWEVPVSPTSNLGAPFVSLASRRAPIISVINLKGGVGKTTLTANLAAALGHEDNHSAKALVIDLDYQRSLTQLSCTPGQLKKAHSRKECIQHFFLRQELDEQSGNPTRHPLQPWQLTPESLSRVLFNSTIEVRRKHREVFRIVPCTEDPEQNEVGSNLDDTEMHLFAEWLTGDGRPDLRLRLRKALHANPVQDEFDFILLDCPPRLSLACINALAASDFVLIPVLLDETSIVSVPQLLQKLVRLKNVPGLMPSLNILGIVGNKVEYITKGSLLAHQQHVWDNRLPEPARRAWECDVHRFATMVPKSAIFGNAAGGLEREFAASCDRSIRDVFSALIDGIKKRIQHEREQLALVSPESRQAAVR